MSVQERLVGNTHPSQQEALQPQNQQVQPVQRRNQAKNSKFYSNCSIKITFTGWGISISTEFLFVLSLLLSATIVLAIVPDEKNQYMFTRIAMPIATVLWILCFFGIPPVRRQLVKELKRRFRSFVQ